MAESTLSLDYAALQKAVGHMLGYGRNTTQWSATDLSDVDDVIESGLRQFYFPPPLPGGYIRTAADKRPYKWSFLRPTTTLTTEDGVGEYDAPDDFASLLGSMASEANSGYSAVRKVALSMVQRYKQAGLQSGYPRFVALTTSLRPKRLEAAANYAVADDGGSQVTLSVTGGEAAYTSNYQLFPDTEAQDDACYFGSDSTFSELYFDVSTAAEYAADSIAWEYYNGTSWTALTVSSDGTDPNDNGGVRPFQQDGALLFTLPTDWEKQTVNTVEAYWVRARVQSGFDITTIPTLNQHEHYVSTAFDHGGGQRWKFVFYPVPDGAYTLTYSYQVMPEMLTDINPYPYGGAQHAETLLESCLSIAEARLEDSQAVHQTKFWERLATSIQLDREQGADYFGYNDDPGSAEFFRDNYVTYNGVLYKE